MSAIKPRRTPVPISSEEKAFIYLLLQRNFPLTTISGCLENRGNASRASSVLSSFRKRFGWSAKDNNYDFERSTHPINKQDEFWNLIKDPKLQREAVSIQYIPQTPHQIVTLPKNESMSLKFDLVQLNGEAAEEEPTEPIKITVQQGDKKYISYSSGKALDAHIEIVRLLDK